MACLLVSVGGFDDPTDYSSVKATITPPMMVRAPQI
jgi:hypothetical protein